MAVPNKKVLILAVIAIVIFLSLITSFSVIRYREDIRSKVSAPPSPIPITGIRKEKPDLCLYAQITGKELLPDKTLTVVTKAKNREIVKFIYSFSNLDNPVSLSGDIPSPISFSLGENYTVIHKSATIALNSLTLRYADFDKPDLNWGSKKPKHIQVSVTFEDTKGEQSERNPKCEVSFDLK